MQTLETPQLTLRGLEDNDYIALHKAFWNDCAIMGDKVCKSVMEVKDRCNHISQNIRDKKEYFWVICDSETKNIQGAISIKDIKEDNMSCKAEFCVGKSYQNKSIASDSLSIVLCYIFTTTEINKINIIIPVDNIAAKKVALKDGFTKDGLLKQEIKLNSSFVDAEIYSMTKDMFVEYLK